MSRKPLAPAGHSGRTAAGNTRDVNVERIGPVTIYKRGLTYFVYYREDGKTHRRRIDGNLAVARATAHKVGEALAQKRISPLSFSRTSPDDLATSYLDAVAGVQKLALRTQDRYKAALDRFKDYCDDAKINAIDTFDLGKVEDFVKWLRGKKRSRNGGKSRSRDFYKIGGIKFVLSTCRTAFNWAGRRRMLPPYHTNPFSDFPIDKLKDSSEESNAGKLFSADQEKSFFCACGDWEQPLFAMLATYGLRVAELTNLLVDDVDLAHGVIHIRSKPFLMWTVKTGRERDLPILPETHLIIERAIGSRKAGFVFINSAFASQRSKLPTFVGPAAFRADAALAVEKLIEANPEATERSRKRALVAFGRSAGQIPERTIRGRFLRLTKKIGCPEFTRVHDLRHLFSTRAQEAGINPILVKDMLGHTTLEMTRRYTHLGIDTMREALLKMQIGSSFQTI